MSSEEHKKAILVVDDESEHLEIMGRRLAQGKYRVITADSGKKALRTMGVEKPGLVLLDIIMPGMNGFETLKKIKEIDREIPVVMVTSIWDEDEYKRCIGAGACEYITKPIDFERLETIILSKLF